MNDDEELERELNYVKPEDDRRFFKTNPPGYNVLIGLGAIFALIGFVIGGIFTSATLGKEGLSPFIAIGIGLASAAFLGLTIPPVLWRGIGPTGRMFFRPFGYLGAGPVLVIIVLGFSLMVAAGKMLTSGIPLSQLATGGPLQGADWQVLSSPHKDKPEAKTMSLAEAKLKCSTLGKGWRLPTAADTDFVNERVKAYQWRRCRFFLDGGPKDQILYLGYEQNKRCWQKFAAIQNEPLEVLCIRR